MVYRMSTRRKIAIASWASPREGNIYGKLILDVDPAIAYIEKLRQSTGEKITITHLVGKAVGIALAQLPDLNGQIILGKYQPHKTVDVSFLVQMDEGKDLAKVKVAQIHQKSLSEIAAELRTGAQRLRNGTDEDFNKSMNLIRILPTWLIRPLVYMIGYITSVLGWGFRSIGLEAMPFGSCIITSVGMLGLDEGYAPPTPFAHVPFYLAVPMIKRRPVVEDEQIVIRSQLDLTATLDHRFVDGYQGAVVAKVLRRLFANPELLDRAYSDSAECRGVMESRPSPALGGNA